MEVGDDPDVGATAQHNRIHGGGMQEFRDGWKPLLAATIGTMCGLFTLTNYTQGFFVGPVISEFGWSAPQFFLSYTVMMCLGLIMTV